MSERTLTTGELIKECLLEYGEYVIEDRALPDVRDGLKPSQRRLLWTMHQMGRGSRAVPVKSASIVGETMAKYHPHGDQACYDTLVNLHWQRHSLVDKRGNFGNRGNLDNSVKYAAMRYTEARLSEFAERILDDIDIIPKVKSFSEEHEEPPVLLARVPLLLLNGCSGIAIGIRTNIPPHNLKEIVEATVHLLDNPSCSVSDLLKYVKGPDYGEGVLLSDKAALRALYETGLGRLVFSCEYHIEDGSKGARRLVITGFAPGFKKDKFIEVTTTLAAQKLLSAPANDEGSKKVGTRVTVEFTDAKIIKDRVLPLLKSSSSYQFYALAGQNRKPELLDLKTILDKFLNFRRRVEDAVLQNDLRKAYERLAHEEAKLAAMDNIKVVIAILESAETTEEAVEQLKKKLKVTDAQADVILGLQLRTLMRRTNRDELTAKIEGQKAKISAINADLKDIDGVVKRRLLEMEKYFDKRGTKLKDGEKGIEDVADIMYYVGVTPQAKIDSYDSLPTKSKAAWSYVSLVATPGRFVVVSDDNVGQFVSLSYLDKFDPKIGPVVGVVSELQPITVAVSKKGQYVAFSTEQRRLNFPVFKELGDDALVGAVGIGEGDSVAVFFSDGEVELLEDLKPTRPNVASKPVKKRSRTNREVVAILPIRKDECLLDSDGSELGSGDLSSYEPATIFPAGKHNLVILEDGRRMLKTLDETMDLMEQGGVKFIVPVQVDDAS